MVSEVAGMKDRIGIVGLGVMGSAMANNLMRAGFSVSGYDIDPEKNEAFGDTGGNAVGSAGEVAMSSDIVLFCLPSVEALHHATENLVAGGREGLLVLEMGTLPLDEKLAARQKMDEAGIELMDVPVSGTGLQAADATLVIFASGSREGYERCIPVFETVGRSHHYLGEFGNGSVMKYIANLLVTIHNLSTAEAHALGIAAGMDPEVVQKVMSDGVGSSKIFDIRGPMMVQDSYEPPAARLAILLKDARIIRDFARSKGAPTPLLDATIPIYERSAEAGLGDLDAAALCRYLEQTAGLERGE